MSRLNPAECDWRPASGRDRDGDKYESFYLVHGSGRILADVSVSVRPDAWYVSFRCKVPESIHPNADDARFIDADSAKKFVIDILTKFDPLTIKEEKPKRTRAKKHAG